MKELTQEEKRVRIAEACGWESIWKDDRKNFRGFHLSHAADGKHRLIPDYFNDFNACYEMEEALRNDQFSYTAYWRALFKVVTGKEWSGDIGYFHFAMVHATAAQRAEAFGKTLNLW